MIEDHPSHRHHPQVRVHRRRSDDPTTKEPTVGLRVLRHLRLGIPREVLDHFRALLTEDRDVREVAVPERAALLFGIREGSVEVEDDKATHRRAPGL